MRTMNYKNLYWHNDKEEHIQNIKNWIDSGAEDMFGNLMQCVVKLMILVHRFPKHLSYFVIILVFIGLIISPDFISSRYLGIFWN